MAVPGKFCPSDDIKLAVSGNKPEKSGIFSEVRNGLFQAFLSVLWKKMSLIADKLYRVSVVFLVGNGSSTCFFCAQPYVPHVFLTCACFFLFVCTCARMCAYTRPREIHNVGLFPSVFPSFKKYPYTISSYSVIYKKTFKISSKKYCVKVAEAEKVRTFATAFERESRWEWQTGKERQTCWRRCTRVSYLAGTQGSEKRISPDESSWKTFSKKLRKNLDGKKKRLTFANAFPLKREHERKIVLWKTLDKQTKM